MRIRISARATTACAVALLLAACHPQMSPQEKLAAWRGLTDAHFRETATIQDDNLDLVASFTTEKGLPGAKHPEDGYYYQHEFLRAFIDKRTGKIQYQLYFTMTYPGPERRYETATYEAPKGTQQGLVTIINRSKSCERSQGVTYCDYREDLGIALDESVVRWVAERYGEGDPVKQGWHYRITAHDGSDFTGLIHPAEPKGLLEAMVSHRLVK
ncbi:MAG TPA: hypothetical protein VMU85_04495 [Stellaceae bacterium]|nr:hypothetical protein [Stellaceae bacterium]